MTRGRPSSRRRLTRDRVLLAVHLLAGADGLQCVAGKAAIARQAGVGVETAGWYLHELASEGIVAEVPRGPGRRTRFVLLDHPHSREVLARP